jgi:hypothetical protein
VVNNAPARVFSFVRQDDNDKVFGVFNFSEDPVTVSFRGALPHGKYRAFNSGDPVTIGNGFELQLPAWSNRVFVKD